MTVRFHFGVVPLEFPCEWSHPRIHHDLYGKTQQDREPFDTWERLTNYPIDNFQILQQIS